MKDAERKNGVLGSVHCVQDKMADRNAISKKNRKEKLAMLVMVQLALTQTHFKLAFYRSITAAVR